MSDETAAAAARRHPRWGVAAQVTAILGVVALALAILLLWVLETSVTTGVNSVMADLGTTTTEAQAKWEAAASALDGLAAQASNHPDAQALMQDGAALVNDIGGSVGSVDDKIGDLVDTLLGVLLAIVVALTVLLVYLMLIHAGIWTLGRHWRRD